MSKIIYFILVVGLVSCSQRYKYERKWSIYIDSFATAIHNSMVAEYKNDDSARRKWDYESKRFADSESHYFNLMKKEEYKNYK